jgi:hypothetical protein
MSSELHENPHSLVLALVGSVFVFFRNGHLFAHFEFASL